MLKDCNDIKIPSILIAILTTVIFTGCYNSGDKPKKVHILEKETDKTHETSIKAKETSLRFAVAPVVSSEKTFFIYEDLSNLIGKKLGLPIVFVQRKTYWEINELLRIGNVNFGLVCTGAYVAGQEEFGLELIAVPLVKGKPVYYSYIIVRNNDFIDSFEKLRGKTFAFSDPLSNSGWLYPRYILFKKGETPEKFFSRYIFTYSHDNSIQAVAEGIVDAAAVDSLIWDSERDKGSPYVKFTKIIQKSSQFGINPIVASPSLDPILKKKIKEILLDLHRDSVSRIILEKTGIEKFVEVPDSIYDSTREMYRKLRRRGVK